MIPATTLPEPAHPQPQEESKTGPSKSASGGRVLDILHFNDAYMIQEHKDHPIGGIPRFLTAWNTFNKLNPLKLFSGDLYSPADLTPIYEGKQMLPLVNALKLHAGTLGNHDFDLEYEDLLDLIKENDFPWIMTNFYLMDENGKQPVAKSKEYLVLDHAGFKIGMIGLAEEDWALSLLTVDPAHTIFLDPVTCAKEWCKKLREEHKCDFIIALTHFRVPNDQKLAKEVQDLDLVLGGHDHMVFIEQHGDVVAVKSGADFRTFGHIHIEETTTPPPKDDKAQTFFIKGKYSVRVEMIQITKDFAPDPELEKFVESCIAGLRKEYEVVIAYSETDLDGRFGHVRLEETNLGNFLSDICLGYTDADFFLGNTGTIRNDSIIPKGEFKYGDLKSILPFEDIIEVALVPGPIVKDILENSVGKFPALEGRFPMVSGIRFAFDPEKPPGSRVEESSIQIAGAPLSLTKTYRMASKRFITTDGRDGFTMVKPLKKVVTEENGIELTKILLHFFDYKSNLPKGGTDKLPHSDPNLKSPSDQKPLGSPRSPGLPVLMHRQSSLTTRTKCVMKTQHLIKGEREGPRKGKQYKIIGPTVEERVINLGKKPEPPKKSVETKQ